MKRGALVLQGEDSAHLPTASVFLLLLTVIAALSSRTVPASEKFETARVSLSQTFGASNTVDRKSKAKLGQTLQGKVQALCADFSLQCQAVETEHASGILMSLASRRLDVVGSAIEPRDQKFIEDFRAFSQQQDVHISVVLAGPQPFGAANTVVLLQLLFAEREELSLDVVTDPIVEYDQIGFLIAPRVRQSP